MSSLVAHQKQQPQDRHDIPGAQVETTIQHAEHASRERASDADLGSGYKFQNLLSLDGGGVRGLWSLLVLEALMNAIGELEEAACRDNHDHEICSSFLPLPYPANVSRYNSEKPATSETDGKRLRGCCQLPRSKRYLPCHYFDIICGSSTGALIAILLGRLRMTVTDCISIYKQLGGDIFGDSSVITFPRLLFEGQKYNTTKFENVIRHVIEDHNEVDPQSENFEDFPRDTGICQTFVTSWKENIVSKRSSNRDRPSKVSKPYLFRSYDNFSKQRKINYGSADKVKIWEVARAASAAHFHFKPQRIDDFNYWDGAVGPDNNPSLRGLKELKSLSGKAFNGVVVSIGTCRSEKILFPFFKPIKSIFERIKNILDTWTDPEEIHEEVESKQKSGDSGWEFKYFRLNNPESLDVQFNEWKPSRSMAKIRKTPGAETIGKIEKAFSEWIGMPHSKEMLRECAEYLVSCRLARKDDDDRWERYADCAEYPCPLKECAETFHSQTAIQKHFHREHESSSPGGPDWLQKIRRCWKYKEADTRMP